MKIATRTSCVGGVNGQEQLVFSQLMELVPRQEFHRGVKRYSNEIQPRKFSCRDPMAFAQL